MQYQDPHLHKQKIPLPRPHTQQHQLGLGSETYKAQPAGPSGPHVLESFSGMLPITSADTIVSYLMTRSLRTYSIELNARAPALLQEVVHLLEDLLSREGGEVGEGLELLVVDRVPHLGRQKGGECQHLHLVVSAPKSTEECIADPAPRKQGPNFGRGVRNEHSRSR